MRILISSEPPRIGSPMKIALHQVRALESRGHDVTFRIQSWRFDASRRALAELFEGVHIQELPRFSGISTVARFLTKAMRGMAGEEINFDVASAVLGGLLLGSGFEQGGYDGVLFHSTLSLLQTLPSLYDRDIARILHVHDVPISVMMQRLEIGDIATRRLVEGFEKWTLRKADLVFCSTRNAAVPWKEVHGVLPEILHPGCIPLSRLPISRKPFAFSMTRWDSERNTGYLIDLASSLRRANLRLIVGGNWANPDLLRDFKTRVRQRGLDDDLLIRTNLSESQVLELYSEAICFVSAPVQDSLIMGALEAAACGTPIVFPKKSGAWEIFEPDAHGFEMPMESPEECAQIIAGLRDPKYFAERSSSIWERAQELTWDAHAGVLENVFRRINSDRGMTM